MILVVDDSPFTGAAIAWALRAAGFEVEVAQDLDDVEHLGDTSRQPELVLMDVVLGAAFGDELATVLRVTYGYRCPILLVSALPEGELAQRVADAKLDGYIPKHAGLRVLVERVRYVLRSGYAAAVAEVELASRFHVSARQRLRRIEDLAASPGRWDPPAISAEMHALAGDAALVGKLGLSSAARTARDIAHGTARELEDALAEVGRLVGGPDHTTARLLLVGDAHPALLADLDAAGFLVLEPRRLDEAARLLRDPVDAIVVTEDSAAAEPELRRRAPGIPLVIVAADATDIVATLFAALGRAA